MFCLLLCGKLHGCDGSVLLNSTQTNQAEREAHVNFGLRGVAEVDQIKAALEHSCPGVVSCADILIMAARDATAKVISTLCNTLFCIHESKTSAEFFSKFKHKI